VSVAKTTLSTPAARLAQPLDWALCIALGALGFFLPFSTAGTSLSLLVLSLLAAAAAPAVWHTRPWRQPVMAAGLIFLAYAALHTLWLEGFNLLALHTLNRYHELIMAPVLLALFHLTSRKRLFFNVLVISAAGYGAIHWVALLDPGLASQLTSRRISAGFGLSVCAFLALQQAHHYRKPWLLRVAAAFLALTVLFAIDGRTGHVVLLVMVGYAAWLHSPPRWRWGALILLPLAAFILAMGSSAVRTRLSETIAGAKTPEGTELSSTGIRLELLRNALALAKVHFVTGAGFARYGQVHEQIARQRYAADPVKSAYLQSSWVKVNNPHNQYLLMLVSGGAPALVLFLVWLLAPLIQKFQGKKVSSSLLGISLAFAVGCLFNSLLTDFTEGHLYAGLLAWLLAQADESDPQVEIKPV